MDSQQMPIGACPSDETLAAFLDVRLSAAERGALVLHLADCPRCRELVSSAALAAAPPAKVPAFRRRWFAGGALAAAAAVIAFGIAVWPRPDASQGSAELAALVEAMGSTRLVEPRLTGGFAYGPVQAVTRGAAPANLDAQVAFARIDKAAAERPSPATRRAHAASLLLQRRPDDAITVLEELTRQQPQDAAAWSDLAAARIVRGAGDDAPAALQAADRARALDPRRPEALFNRALALERLGRRAESRAAWESYLAADPKSGWAGEAREHAAALASGSPAQRP